MDLKELLVFKEQPEFKVNKELKEKQEFKEYKVNKELMGIKE